MRHYRVGDRGEAISDIQTRLADLGLAVAVTAVFDEATRLAVTAFQQRRGLPAEGIVDDTTWKHLVEAGRRPGDRILYYRRPMMRGDDVAELQHTLNLLGFDAGKEDGIFGVETQRGTLEFQESRGLGEDGIAGPVTMLELKRVGRAIGEAGRHNVAERQWLRTMPRDLAGLTVAVDAECRTASEAAHTWSAATAAVSSLSDHGAKPLLTRSEDVWADESLRAEHCNRIGSDFVIGFACDQEEGIFFFGSPTSHSEAGARLGQHLSRILELPSKGRSTPLLRETRAPAIVVAVREPNAALGKACVEGLQLFLAGD
jgi:N-acetylmuramoyl-L-alanine amidase